MSNREARVEVFKESPKWVFTVPSRWGASQRPPCLRWYLSTCWRAAIRCPLGSLRWRMRNYLCQASINISFVVIVHYARAVTCVGLCFLLVFVLLFQSVWLRQCCVVTAPVWSDFAPLTRLKAGLHVAQFVLVLSLYTGACQVSLHNVFFCLLAYKGYSRIHETFFFQNCWDPPSHPPSSAYFI